MGRVGACVLATLALAHGTLETATKRSPRPLRVGRGGGAPEKEAKEAKAGPNVFDVVLAGALATAIGDVAMHPIDTIKTTQQATGIGMMAAVSQLSKRGGIAPFYDGVVPYAIADGLAGAVKFATYERCKQWCAANLPEDALPTSNFACAAVAFFACSVVLVPGELLKQRLQAGVYPGLITGVKTLLTTEGPRALFTGYGATLVRDVPYTVLELGLYDLFKSFVTKARGSENSGTPDELLAAAITGGLVGWVTTPLDVIKTRMMTATPGAALAGPVAVGVNLWREGGSSVLFAGSAARVAWLAPFTTIYFGCYEVAKRTLARVRGDREAL